MGGKTKQSQRTKNNARPSSSGRSAELLNSVKLEAGVVNIAGTQLPALFPTLVAPAVDPLVSPELQLCLKKLNKKDPITKTKALQELTELVATSPVDDVVAALPSWAHFYKILTADPDRKVRECTQACHGALVGACGRRAARCLRQLLAPWLQAQHDDHAPAQALAARSLAKTFPDNKLPEVISFCKEPLVSSLLEVLLATGEPPHIKKIESPEEREALTARAEVSALRGLQYTCGRLPAPHSAWLWAQLQPLLASSAFWKKASSTDAKIRGAWLGVTGALAARWGAQWAAAHGARALRVLLAAPAADAPRWDCLLLLMHNVPDWHQYLEKKELLSKRILELLENGGWGDVKHLSNILLPILASLPDEILTKDFYVNFFNALFSMLEKKTILSSKIERQHWITTLDECLRYLSTQAHDYVLEVVAAAHRTWLEEVLVGTGGQTRNHLIKHSANAMTNLVKYWLKQASEGNERYDTLIRNFWQNVGSSLTAQIEKLPLNNDDIEELLDAHILLQQTLKTSFSQELKKQHSIKFEAGPPAPEPAPMARVHVADPAAVARYHRDLDELVQRMCGLYFEFAGSTEISSPVISPVITLLVEFDSEELFLSIARRFDCDSVYKLYDGVLRPWLRGDTMRCRALVDVLFMLLPHLDERDQDAVFGSFEQFPPSVVEWCLARSVAHPARALPAARRWTRGDACARALAALAARAAGPAAASARPLLLLALAPIAAESVVSEEAVQGVVRVACAALQADSAALQAESAAPEVDSEALEAHCALAVQLAAALPPDAALLAALLDLAAALPRGDPRLSLEAWREARDAAQDGAAALAPAARAAFLPRAAAALRRHFLRLAASKEIPLENPDASTDTKESGPQLNMAGVEHVASLAAGVARGAGASAREAARFSGALLPARNDAHAPQAHALRHYLLMGHLSCPYEDEPVVKVIAGDTLTELATDELIVHANTALFRLLYLRDLLLHRPDEDSDTNCCQDLLAEEYFQDEFVNCIHDYVVMTALCEGYAFWPHYRLIEQCKNRLEMLLDEIIKEIPTDNRNSISEALAKMSVSKGYFWAYARRYFEAQTELPEDSEKTDTQSDNANNESDNAVNQSDNADNQSENADIQSDNASTESCSQSEGSVNKTESASKVGDSENLFAVTNLEDMITGPTFLHTLHYLQANAKWTPSQAQQVAQQAALGAQLAALAGAPAAAALVRALRAGAAPLDALLDTYYTHNHTMLYDRELSGCPWSLVAGNASVCRALAACAADAACAWEAPARLWDFTNISLCSLLTSLQLSRDRWGTAKVALLGRSVLQLFSAVAVFVASVRARCEREQPAAHVAALPAEWADIYAPDLNHNLFSIILHVLETSSTSPVNSNHIAVISSLIACTEHMQWEALPAARREELSLQRLVEAAADALAAAGHTAYKYLAYSLLAALHKPLVLDDAERLAAWSQRAADGADEPLQLSLRHYERALRHLQDVVPTALAHVRLCEEVCSTVPWSDAHALALGWLLLGDALPRQCALARHDLTHHYIQMYREQKYTEPLLEAALRLLPGDVLLPAPAQRPSAFAAAFTAHPDLDVYKYCGAAAVRAAACRGVWWSVCGAGAGAARGWRGAAKPKHAALLDDVTQRYITPHVVKQEFALLQAKGSEIEDAEIWLSWAAYEVTCSLRVDESAVQLRATLARAHPLQLPRLRAPPPAPPAALNWLLMYLGYQNGTILNALKMWTASVNSKMERAPQCYICYCRLHHATARLPDVHCHTCKNKFHNVCLRKWFLSSSKMTCPLCRANF